MFWDRFAILFHFISYQTNYFALIIRYRSSQRSLIKCNNPKTSFFLELLYILYLLKYFISILTKKNRKRHHLKISLKRFMFYIFGDTLFRFVCLIFYDFFYLTTFDFIMFSSIFKKNWRKLKNKFYFSLVKRNRYSTRVYLTTARRGLTEHFSCLKWGNSWFCHPNLRTQRLPLKPKCGSDFDFHSVFI